MAWKAFLSNPVFADIDNDGDFDSFAGNEDGTVSFFINNSGELLASTAGNDRLTGTSSNNDTVTYASATTSVNVSLNITTQQDTVGAGLDTLTSIENLVGGSFNDNLIGNTANNILRGGDGNDTLRGWSGADNMLGEGGDDTYFVENVGDIVREDHLEGTDYVNSSVTYTISNNIENLTLAGTLAINGTGNIGSNYILGNSANNILDGGAWLGDDTLNGGAGADTLIGGGGYDNYVVDNVGDVIVEDGPSIYYNGIDSVSSSVSYTLSDYVENLSLAGIEPINGTGNASINEIIGNSAANILTGDAGNDTLNGGIGADTLVGGLGGDTYIVDNINDVIIENLSEGFDKVNSSVNYILSINVDNLILTGISAINGTGNNQVNTITGNTAANELNGGAAADILEGGLGNDTYFVENGGDKVIEKLNEGTDTVSSKITHTLLSNVENLILTGTAAIDGTGNDLANVITGNNAINTLNGDIGNDTLNGGGGNDTLIGWNDADAMSGGLGNDTYFVENGGDKVIEKLNEGTDTVSSKITHTLSANVENLTLTSIATINATGNGLANVITGNNAANQLAGGTGNDIFKFIAKGPSDKITDYNVASDTIQLENAAFTALTTTGTLNASQFRIGTNALDANDFVIYNKTAGALLYDADGIGATAATQIATIGIGLNMTNADIVVI